MFDDELVFEEEEEEREDDYDDDDEYENENEGKRRKYDEDDEEHHRIEMIEEDGRYSDEILRVNKAEACKLKTGYRNHHIYFDD